MSRLSLLLALVPLVGLGELGLHRFFAARAPDAADYVALGAELSRLKREGEPVVVAPAWAEPWVRQAAPRAFPLNELARPEDRGFAAFWEVSLLGAEAGDLTAFPVREEHALGVFRVRRRENPKPEPTLFDFVTAVDEGRAEVSIELDRGREPCVFTAEAKSETGGLHGHVAYPRRRYTCQDGRFVGVTLIEDRDYRPRRCVLAQPPASGRVTLRFTDLPSGTKVVGFVGASYFLERQATGPQIELRIRSDDGPAFSRAVSGAQGWTRFELGRVPGSTQLEVELSRLSRGNADFCFSLEAK